MYEDTDIQCQRLGDEFLLDWTYFKQECVDVWGFPGGLVVKNPPLNAGRCQRQGFNL